MDCIASLPPSASETAPPPAVGIGWRQPHYAQLLEQRPPLAFLEVHSENFFGDGGAALQVLQAGREHYPVSLHGVGLALGSAIGLDAGHLERLRALVRRIDPVRVSDHASFGRGVLAPGAAPMHGADLLPVAHTQAALDIMVDHVERVQSVLGRTLLVENLSAYLQWADDEFEEAEFFRRLVQRSGCAVLLDVNNLVVNALNRGADPLAHACAFIDAMPAGSVGEIHLAGHADLGDIVIDDHGSRVSQVVWRAYAHAVRRLGPVPTLIEWDTDVPALDVLLDEAAQAGRIQQEHAPWVYL